MQPAVGTASTTWAGSFLVVRAPNQPLARLSQSELVGVTCRTKRGWANSHRAAAPVRPRPSGGSSRRPPPSGAGAAQLRSRHLHRCAPSPGRAAGRSRPARRRGRRSRARGSDAGLCHLVHLSLGRGLRSRGLVTGRPPETQRFPRPMPLPPPVATATRTAALPSRGLDVPSQSTPLPGPVVSRVRARRSSKALRSRGSSPSDGCSYQATTATLNAVMAA